MTNRTAPESPPDPIEPTNDDYETALDRMDRGELEEWLSNDVDFELVREAILMSRGLWRAFCLHFDEKAVEIAKDRMEGEVER